MRQPLWIILRRLPEKGRKWQDERDSGEPGKVIDTCKTNKTTFFPICYKNSRPLPHHSRRRARTDDFYMWAAACKNLSSGICGQRRRRSACASAQSDLRLRCPLTESFKTVKRRVNARMETLHMRGMNLNMGISRTVDDTFSFDVLHVVSWQWLCA